MKSVVRRVGQVLRVVLFMAMVMAVALVWWWRTAEAQLSRRLLDFGDQVRELSRGGAPGTEQRFVINGAMFSVVAKTLRQSPTAAIDAFARECNRGADAPKNSTSSQAQKRLQALRTLRANGDDAAAVSCFVGKPTHTPRDYVKQLRTLVESGDAEELGAFRFGYAYLHKKLTHLVSVESEGSLPLFEMFPSDKDAPGTDIPNAPRPADSRRMLSAVHVSQSPTGAPSEWMNVYAVRGRTELAMRDFEQKLKRSGFELRSRSDDFLAANLGSTRLIASFKNDKRIGVVATIHQVRGGR